MASQSYGLSVRRSINSTLTPCSRSMRCAACKARGTTAPYVTTVEDHDRHQNAVFALPNGIIVNPAQGTELRAQRSSRDRDACRSRKSTADRRSGSRCVAVRWHQEHLTGRPRTFPACA